ncbi:helix-turn-helix transcriptional regulator [Methylocella sp. CPCC 101449]|uniref:helix-turn-helix transcriptional regulator n=1 Tax=Methylocella sp. CPCC 101449 TaxID=2987531 RepID=UPI0028920039|nr:helix-turn-helix transcriptional regulator [Methylocella sp. CPCC 101449]MDT2024339.1 helix-turn-helix transcriptional regulator [Methylocella sp. CPCC 101449]
MLDADQRRLLGAFIRTHRERLRPNLPGRRRTPGLRREELAAEAGLSATWCAWLEQGRPVQASPDALGRLAKALSLTQAERAYLFELAGRLDPQAPTELEADAPASLVAIVQDLAHPAYGLDRLWNACCWNPAAARLFHGWLDGDHQRNLLRYIFLEETARRLIHEWEDRARRLLAEFRADYGHTFRDARVKSLVDSLRQESPLFAQAWAEQDVQHRAGGLRTFDHPLDGPLAYTQHTFTPSERPDYKLVMLVPLAREEGRSAKTRAKTPRIKKERDGR